MDLVQGQRLWLERPRQSHKKGAVYGDLSGPGFTLRNPDRPEIVAYFLTLRPLYSLRRPNHRLVAQDRMLRRFACRKPEGRCCQTVKTDHRRCPRLWCGSHRYHVSNLSLNLDSRQCEMGYDAEIPIFQATQLMSLAFGQGEEKASLGNNLTDPAPYLRDKGMLP